MWFTAFILTAAAPPFLDGPEFAKQVQEKALHATVRLKNTVAKGDEQITLEGTAVRIGRVGSYSYFLTAAHCVENSLSLVIEVFDPRQFPSKVTGLEGARIECIDSGRDLALLLVSEEEAGPHLTIAAVNETPTVFPAAALSVGCPIGKFPDLRAESLLAKKLIQKKKTDTMALSAWVTKDLPESGRSGGPMVNSQGQLIGICSGNDDKSGYFVEVHEIRRFLEINRFGRTFLKKK